MSICRHCGRTYSPCDDDDVFCSTACENGVVPAAEWHRLNDRVATLSARVAELEAENARLNALCDENGIDTGPGPLPLNPQPCGCEFDGFELIGRCHEHQTGHLPEIHYIGGLTRRFDEDGFCYAESEPMPKRVQDAIDEVFERRFGELTPMESIRIISQPK